MKDIPTAVRIIDKERILACLETDRLYAAYAIGDLEPELFAECAWAGAESGGRLRALGLVFRGLDPPAFFMLGEPPGLRAILGSALHPPRAYLTYRARHLPVVEEFYAWEQPPDAMWRMVLREKRFRAPAGDCVRLRAGHAAQVRNLVARGGVSGFAAAQIDRGIFYGIFRDERLAAVAGTHLVSPAYGIAAVGNVATDPEERGRGLGTAVVSAVLAELDRLGMRDIVLNVRQDNPPAIRLYEKLGFERHCAFFEGLASLRTAAAPPAD
jgi:ribosomal protein S18 acetylase RimI-like enzyme